MGQNGIGDGMVCCGRDSNGTETHKRRCVASSKGRTVEWTVGREVVRLG